MISNDHFGLCFFSMLFLEIGTGTEVIGDSLKRMELQS